MNFIISVAIILIGGLLGIFLDLSGFTREPVVFWFIGNLGGFIAGCFAYKWVK